MEFPDQPSNIHFHHVDGEVVREDTSALKAYADMTAYNPCWLRTAFEIRDMCCALFQLQPIGGFSGSAPSEDIAAGDKLDFFDVQKISDEELVLASSDKHLVVVVALNLAPAIAGKRKLSVTTSVKIHNLLGKLYMLPVKPVHGIIVRKMLDRLKQPNSFVD